MFSRCIHGAACVMISFIVIVERFAIVWIFCLLSNYWPVNGQLAVFTFLAIMNKMLQRSSIYRFLGKHVFLFSWVLPRYAISASSDNSVFYFLKNCQNVFRTICIIFLSHQQGSSRASVSPHLPQTVIVCFFCFFF